MGIFDGKKKYSESDKYKYRSENCKKGSTYKTKDGQVKEWSDFKRGEMMGRLKESQRSLAIANLKAGKKWDPDTKRYK